MPFPFLHARSHEPTQYHVLSNIIYACIRSIDDTHVIASIPKRMEHSFHGKKSYVTQNVMVVVYFDLRFTSVLGVGRGQHEIL
jgi:hypothetical protein